MYAPSGGAIVKEAPSTPVVIPDYASQVPHLLWAGAR
jgi:hypothetical protein